MGMEARRDRSNSLRDGGRNECRLCGVGTAKEKGKNRSDVGYCRRLNPERGDEHNHWDSMGAARHNCIFRQVRGFYLLSDRGIIGLLNGNVYCGDVLVRSGRRQWEHRGLLPKLQKEIATRRI